MQRGGLSVIEPQTFSGIFYAEMVFPMVVLLVQDIQKLRRHASSVIFHLYYESVHLPPSCYHKQRGPVYSMQPVLDAVFRNGLEKQLMHRLFAAIESRLQKI